MRNFRLPSKTLILWQLRTIVSGLILSLIAFNLYILYNSLLFVLFIIIAIALILIFWYLPKYFKTFKIRLSDDGVIVKRGVIIKSTHFLPFSRLIYTQTITSPIARIFRLKAITLKAARSAILIPELTKDDADRLLLFLSKGDKK